jgi:hypothetical protein
MVVYLPTYLATACGVTFAIYVRSTPYCDATLSLSTRHPKTLLGPSNMACAALPCAALHCTRQQTVVRPDSSSAARGPGHKSPLCIQYFQRGRGSAARTHARSTAAAPFPTHSAFLDPSCTCVFVCCAAVLHADADVDAEIGACVAYR